MEANYSIMYQKVTNSQQRLKNTSIWVTVMVAFNNVIEVSRYWCSCKKVFWKYVANIQENIHAKVRFQ